MKPALERAIERVVGEPIEDLRRRPLCEQRRRTEDRLGRVFRLTAGPGGQSSKELDREIDEILRRP